MTKLKRPIFPQSKGSVWALEASMRPHEMVERHARTPTVSVRMRDNPTRWVSNYAPREKLTPINTEADSRVCLSLPSYSSHSAFWTIQARATVLRRMRRSPKFTHPSPDHVVSSPSSTGVIPWPEIEANSTRPGVTHHALNRIGGGSHRTDLFPMHGLGHNQGPIGPIQIHGLPIGFCS